MRIAILTQYFPPEFGATQVRLRELSERLTKRGHVVTVMTAMPHYPGGRVFPEYRRKVIAQEQRNGSRVIRFPLFASNSKRPSVRLASYLSFTASSLLMSPFRVSKQDVLLVETPPMVLGLSGIVLSKLLRTPMVLMVADIWPDVAIQLGGVISDRQARMMARLASFIYRRSACLATPNIGMRDVLRKQYPQVRSEVMPNGVDTLDFSPSRRCAETRQDLGITEGSLAVGYFGLHGFFQGLDVVIEAAERLAKNKGVRFILIGDGPTKNDLIAAVKKKNLQNVTFVSPQPHAKMPKFVASVDLCVVPLGGRLAGTMPSKIYEALASGVPVLATRGCEAENLIKQNAVGRLFDPSDGAALANAIDELCASERLRQKMGRTAVELAQQFDRHRLFDKTEQLLQSVVKRH